MEAIECRDIFNAVYINVRACYIEKLYSSKLKSIEVSENINEDENLTMTKTSEPQGETNVNSKEKIGSNSETVRESVERKAEAEVAGKIRADIDEKLPFALASVCSDLAHLDREYRRIMGYDEQPEFSEFKIEIFEDFPLSQKFSFSAIMYLCSMILIDIDENRSDDFYDKYATSVSKIISELPFECKKTVEKYPY